MRRRDGIFQRIDWITVIMYLALVLIGWVNIYAAVFNEDHHSIFDISQRYGKQLIWIGAALIMAIGILMIDERFFPSFAYLIYGVVMFLLLGVLIFGKEIKGAQSWYMIGSFAFQPSEFAKFATNLALAKYLSTLNIRITDIRTKIVSGVIIFLPAALILLQPDTGSTLIYASFLFVLYREGLSGNIFVAGIAVAVLFIVTLLIRDVTVALPLNFNLEGGYILVAILGILSLLLMFLLRRIKRIGLLIMAGFILSSAVVLSVNYVFENVLQEHQTKRIDILLGIESDPKGAGYNVNQSLIAIGSGGLSGKGLLQGTQTKFDFVPEQSTDFIFCTIGEEWGFVGSFVLITLFVGFLIRLIQLAERQRSAFGRIYGYGVVSILFFHFAINIGMTIGLAPVIGIPLPFISYGGSSLWAFTILLFIMIKLDSDRLDIL